VVKKKRKGEDRLVIDKNVSWGEGGRKFPTTILSRREKEGKKEATSFRYLQQVARKREGRSSTSSRERVARGGV